MKAQEFIAKLQAEIAEKEQKQREVKLISLGLYEEKEEILDNKSNAKKLTPSQ